MHSVLFEHMGSFNYKMGLARERAMRIAAVVASEQALLALAAPMPTGRGNHAFNRRLAFWRAKVRELGSAS
jgi:hypothetical protein